VGLRRVDPGSGSITTALGVLGMPGFTAYAGMEVIAPDGDRLGS
jgi:NADPH-dependent curcumin reductase CurA